MNIIRSFQNRSKTIRYLLVNCTNPGEQKIIDACIAFAYNASGFALQSLKSGDAPDVSQKIYGDMFDAPRLIDVYKRIMELVDSRLKIRREPIFISESGEAFEEVLSSASLSSKEIIVYDSLFSESLAINSRLTSKIATILHETAHLIGLKSDASFGDINSAECLQNFTLLICGIIDIPDIQSGMENLKGKDGELPNWETQPRAPAGTHEGGQWIKEGAPTTPSKKVEKDQKATGGNSRKSPQEKLDKNIKEEIENFIKDLPEQNSIVSWNEDSFSFEKVKELPGDIDIKEDEDIEAHKIEKTYIWGAVNIEINDLEPNTDYTIWFIQKYKYKDSETGEEKEKSYAWAYGIKSDENGSAYLDRVGIINQDKANSVQEIKDGTIDIESNIIPIKGKVRENFDSIDKVNWKSFKDEEMRENKYEDNKKDPFYDTQKKYGLGSYGAAHANYESEDGGGVNNQLPKNKPINKKTIKFHIDLDKETIKTDGKIVDYNLKGGGASNKEKKSGKPLRRLKDKF